MMVDTLCAIKKAMENVSVENDEWYEEGEGEGGGVRVGGGRGHSSQITNEWCSKKERLLTMSFLFTTTVGSTGQSAAAAE